MNMELVQTLKFIFRNLIDRKQCNECHVHWFHFNHDGEGEAYYRLGDNEPSTCAVCDELDQELERNKILTSERWFEL